MEKSDGGWWKGVCEGRVGWFPESYVRPAPMEARESMSATQPANMEEMMKTGTVSACLCLSSIGLNESESSLSGRNYVWIVQFRFSNANSELYQKIPWLINGEKVQYRGLVKIVYGTE